MKKMILSLLLLFPTVVYGQSIKVESSGVYTGPLQTTASPVVVELFSAQNCPACPPADEYMKSLINSKGVIALSCHVDYFGKSSAGLSKPFCTKRQTRYIKQIGRKSHFTPQMMVNGHMSEVGYETSDVAASIVKGRSERVQRITITSPAQNVFNFKLGASSSKQADLWMAVYQKPKSVTRRGKTTTYYNVIKDIIPLGVWNGSAVNRVISPIVDRDSAGFAIVAQDKRDGKILAAGNYKL